jgi:hypothetical protein
LSFPSTEASSNATDPVKAQPASSSPSSAPPGANPTHEPEKRLAGAQNKLRAALDGLDAALALHAERALETADESAEFSAMQEDRSRLAQELDAATARLRAFEAANGEALARVERASAAVRALLAADKSADCGAAFSEEN